EADAAAAAQAAADAEAAAKAEADAAAAAQETADAEAAAKAEADAAAAAQETADAEAAAKAAADAAAAVVAEPIDAPVVSAEEAQVLTDILSAPGALDGTLPEAVTALAPGAAEGTAPAAGGDPTATPPTAPQQVTVTTVTEGTTRSSAEEFDKAPQVVAGDKKSGLSDLEKVGLLALGALVVGAVLNDGREVVSNTGDRVVVRDADGGYAVYKDDDTLLRRPGSTVQTETFRDGSTRSTVNRADNTQVVTIRDASGRVLRRAVLDARGTEVVLIDDLVREDRIDVSTLPVPRPDRVTISTNDGDAALKAALAREEAAALGRSFSLRQIREIAQVRALAATLDVDNITFDSGSAVILPSEARKLAAIGRILEQLLRDNPGEVFLIEGHTDAVGSAFSNLTLSDRRAESVALALTEYYGIPPENMVVQGYGEGELRVPSAGDERANRRAAVRVIMPLMRSASR
ncbi:MAG: OmpA family protein, partial [Rhodobacteraceae bacterium]|nr:OmpA family protein [Paracoccaceae bacterium]